MATSRKSGSPPDPLAGWSVTIPINDLEALLAAARRLPELEKELRRCYDQLDACRRVQVEVLEKYQELYKLL